MTVCAASASAGDEGAVVHSVSSHLGCAVSPDLLSNALHTLFDYCSYE